MESLTVGCPEEITLQESRVGMTPSGAAQRRRRGIRVIVEEHVIHYCVANMPGADPARKSTQALTSVRPPNVQRLALAGVGGAIEVRPELVPGINCRDGRLIQSEMAASHG